jgi:ATP-dependent helicase HrpB
VSTSRASAEQRAGRAGRTEPGVCYRLWSKLEQGTRLAHLPAEITQVDLAGLALELAAWNADPASLAFVDPPPAKALAAARELLVDLGALVESGESGSTITGMGRAMLALPLHPRLAHMVVAAPDADRPLACVIAAIVDERDLLRGRADELPADLALRVRVVCGDERHDRADRRVTERVRDRALDIARRAGVPLVLREVDADRAGAVLALGFPDRVAVRRSQPGQFQLRTGGGAWVAKDDPLAREPFIVAADLDGNRTSARVRLGAGLDAAELERALAHRIDRRESLVWDKERNDLVLRVEARLGNMVIADRRQSPPAGPPTVAALLQRVVATRLGALDMASAASLRARVAFVRRLQPGGDWPDLGDRALVETVDDWLAPYLVAATGRSDLDRLDVAMLLSSQWSWDRQMSLADLAPLSFTTPTGRDVTIDYARDLPTAAVRVQDLFGMVTHPTVMNGTVPVALELLSPADRPLQITSDLPGFWRGTWADVRKEMAGRYPKHHWPVDPSTAPPKRLKDR